MDDTAALRLALVTVRAFQAGELSPLATARRMTGIVNPRRYWWDELGGAHGPLSSFYAADDAGMKLPWIGLDVELWHPSLRETKRAQLQSMEAQWQQPISAACAALSEYAATRQIEEAG
jgi:hypothetical protein